MARFGLLSLALTFAAVIGISAATSPAQAGDPPCQRTKFETKLVADACKAGGQKAAKDAMKKFMKEAKKKDSTVDCGSCHSKLAPKYPNKPDALKKFKELGGS